MKHRKKERLGIGGHKSVEKSSDRKASSGWIGMLGIVAMLILQGCIHEYPLAIKGNYPEKGEDPTTVSAQINVSYNLTWENLLHYIDFSTRAPRGERPHRFVIEILDDGEQIYHEEDYLTPEQFSVGTLIHKISIPLKPKEYQLAVWYDCQTESGDYHFDTQDLKNVSLTDFSTREVENKKCAYASDKLDLKGFAERGEANLLKELELGHAGSRFEIIATDIQQFITNQRDALFQGDTFTSNLSFLSGVGTSFNLHSSVPYLSKENVVYSGWMRLPFDDYDELVIAEGFLFSREEDEVRVKLKVTNNALLPVCETEEFSFPVKRGYITSVRGDFLTNPIDGVFSVDHIWEGEIIQEI